MSGLWLLFFRKEDRFKGEDFGFFEKIAPTFPKMTPFLLLAGILLQVNSALQANYSKCPGYWEVMPDYVAKNFSVDLFTGEYYEQYFLDYFEDICPDRRCMHTVKSVNYTIGEYGQILDNFTIECAGKLHVEPIYDNITNITGFVWMFWDGITDWIYPDTIIGFSNNTVYNSKLDTYQYEWVIEFQCMDKTEIDNEVSEIYYVGINAYSNVPNPSQEIKTEILNAIKQAGIEMYTDNYGKLHSINQTACVYP